MTIDLNGHRALITGGSRGIGRATALALARAGAAVVACHRTDSEAADAATRELQEAGGQMIRADVSQPDDVDALLQHCARELGGLDILVNNAGVMSIVPYADLTLREWQRLIDINLTAVHLVCHAALPLLTPPAAIINIGSGLALTGIPARAHYTASKAAVVGFSRSLAKELGPRGIRVNTIEPGIIETDLIARLGPDERAQYAKLTALRRLGRPDDIAEAVLFLASPHASYITGTTLHINGGM